MGYPEKPQMEGTHLLESEGKKWVIAGIQLRGGPLKPIFTIPVEKQREIDEEDGFPTTPTAAESRIPAKLPCPPPPRKRKSSSRCNSYSGVREFFTPPDLETVFIRRVERA